MIILSICGIDLQQHKSVGVDNQGAVFCFSWISFYLSNLALLQIDRYDVDHIASFLTVYRIPTKTGVFFHGHALKMFAIKKWAGLTFVTTVFIATWLLTLSLRCKPVQSH